MTKIITHIRLILFRQGPHSLMWQYWHFAMLDLCIKYATTDATMTAATSITNGINIFILPLHL